MSKEMCQHGYLPGMCPKGCKDDTTDASKEEGVEHPPVHYNQFKSVETVENLNCAICTMPVQEGRVYKGRAICKTCEDGLKGEAPKESGVPPISEDIKDKFPQQE